ncbi:MAG: nucleotide sugar dehydrogenase [Candidatus Omnitrophica bacterium]|nr:nucleotide sugar dehydrogenase [Candidatus Omnitrophota bacterium]
MKVQKNKKKSAGFLKGRVCVVGGAGHVGLPLGLVFADRGFEVVVYDLNIEALNTIRSGRVPFMEKGSAALLEKVLKSGKLLLSNDPHAIAGAEVVIITIGTPVDEFLNPDTKVIKDCMDRLLPYLDDGQLILLRSTVYPGTTQWLDKYLKRNKKKVRVAFCPERVVQGYAIEEVQKLPQIVSGVTPEAEEDAARLFARIAPQVVRLRPMEAEFAKLFSNAYRYIQFAISNQFFMIAHSAGLDFDRIIEGMKKNYPRAAEIPRAGFAAGPCLLKDTMQLAAFSDNQFSLGHSAMNINEGLVLYLVAALEKKYRLDRSVVGLLGMAFKAESDDIRSSLSYKLKKVLLYHAKEVLTTDPYVKTDPSLLDASEVIRKSDLLILCVPHKAYRKLRFGKKPVVDIWGFLNKGTGI